jgi:hypothetical protein
MFCTSTHPAEINESFENGATLNVQKSVFLEDEVNNAKRLLATDWQKYFPTDQARNLSFPNSGVDFYSGDWMQFHTFNIELIVLRWFPV